MNGHRPYNDGSRSSTGSSNNKGGADTQAFAPNLSNHGTLGITFSPYIEQTTYDEISLFDTITSQSDCMNFSLEELRVADYALGKMPNMKSSSSGTFLRGSCINKDFTSTMTCKEGKMTKNLSLLKGPGIQVVVGKSSTSFPSCGQQESWCLPKGLISRYSPFLKAACTSNFKEWHENRISLPMDEPKVFTLFVQWMYYGGYTLSSEPLLMAKLGLSTDLDAAAWVLGDMLLSTGFKNYAMKRLYSRHTTPKQPGEVTTKDLVYACENSTPDSPLRRFYFDFIVTHFADPSRVKGTTEDWDKVLSQYPDARSFLLGSFRLHPWLRNFLTGWESYMEKDTAQTSTPTKTLLSES